MKLKRVGRALGGAVALVALEAAYAVLRPAPDLPEFDPSGEFGDPDDPEFRVAVLGDSSVTAPGVAGPSEIWVSRVCERLSVGRRITLRSLAEGGSTAADLIAGQLHAAVAFRPDLVFVSVGANDVIKGATRAAFEENMDRLIGDLAAGGAQVVQSGVGYLGTIPRVHPPLSALLERRARAFDRIHRRVAERHGAVVVAHRQTDRRRWRNDPELWAADLFHVSAAGHARWAETTWRTVEPLVMDASTP